MSTPVTWSFSQISRKVLEFLTNHSTFQTQGVGLKFCVLFPVGKPDGADVVGQYGVGKYNGVMCCG